MKISLFHNHRAGDATSLPLIRELIEGFGHEVVRVLDWEAPLEDVVGDHTELVVAAGGDGTAAAAARLLAGTSMPLAVLPLGTANNIAKALHSEAPSEELVACWETATRRRFDLGVVRGAWGERRFLEGVGVGLVAAVITSVHAKPVTAHDVPSKLTRATMRYLEVLSDLEPRRSTLTIDGRSISGDFLLAEILNIRSVGPNLVLSPDADPSDGYFSVVTATEDHRELVIAHLSDLIEGREGSLSLPTTLGRQIDVETVDDIHVDDDIVRHPMSAAISVQIEAASVEFLVCD